jgi:hypothetical protein
MQLPLLADDFGALRRNPVSQKNPMKRITILFCLMSAVLIPAAQSAVEVTARTHVFSGDYALNGPFPSYQPLADIVIAEQAKDDFALQTNATLVLSVPGWRFEPGIGQVSANNGDLSNGRVAITDTAVTITFTARKTQKLDTLTLSGLRVRANDGADLKAEKMVRPQADPGTAVIDGVRVNTTVFAYLGQTAPLWNASAALSVVGMTNEHALLRYGVLSNGPCYLEASYDFVNWTTIATNTVSSNSIVYFEDLSSGALPNRFYRLKQF